MTLKGISDVHFNKGLELFKNNDMSNALREFDTALDYDEDNWSLLNVMGLCYYKLGEFSKAKAAWTRSSHIGNCEENRASEYLSSLEEEGFKKMIEDANKALELSGKGDYKEAIALFDRGNIRSYSITSFENIYGLCNYAIGKRAAAVRTWKDVLNMDRGNEEAARYIIETAGLREEEKGLLGWLKNIIKGNRSS